MYASLPFLRRFATASRCSLLFSNSLLLIAGVLCASAAAQEPLRAIINRELALPSGMTITASGDAEYLRRVSLDLVGMPPTADEARKFLTSADPAKREKLVDQLLASPEHTRHLASTLDVMLMERRPNTNVSQDDWMNWLLQSVRANKPWNMLVRELLTADGDSAESRPAARFLLDRAAEPNVVARDLGRLFFGRDMQCAQCHDSPIVSDFLQKDYQGLLAVSSATYTVVKKIDGKDVTILADRSGSDLTFESVFSKGNAHRTGARLPGGTTLAEPFLIPGDEYRVPPADGVRSVPKLSRRQWLAESATSGKHRLFNENAANRFWSLMFGRGLVQPLDMLHPDNPAVSPVLLRQLGDWLVASNYDLRTFLREVALSEPYQRPFDLPAETLAQLVAAQREAEQLTVAKVSMEASLTATNQTREALETAYSAAETALLPVAAERDKVRGQAAEARKKLDEAQKAVNDANAALGTKNKIAEALAASVASLKQVKAAIPDDATVISAEQVISAKSMAVQNELPALQQAVADKTTALGAPTDSLKAAVGALEAAHQQTNPLNEALLAAESQLVAARAAYQDAQLQLTSLETRLAALTRMSSVSKVQRSMEEAAQNVASQQAEVTAVTQAVNDFASTAVAAATELKAATSQRDAMQTVVQQQAAKSDIEKAKAERLAQAVAALGRVEKLLGDDTGLRQTGAVLSSRAEVAVVAAETQQKMTAAAVAQLQQADESMKTSLVKMAETEAEMKRRQEMVEVASKSVAEVQKRQSEIQSELESAMAPVPGDLAARFALSQLKALTPEQLCWTIFRVTTVYDRYRAGEMAELDKASPLTDAQKLDPATIAARQIQVEQRTWDKLKGNLGQYVAIYGGAPGQPQGDFYASADQALFTANGSAINSWVAPAGDNPAERIIRLEDNRLAAEELYLGILTRMPTEEEVQEVTAFLAQRTDRSKAAQELVWGLLSSAEFRFNR